jgi:hypothetical protein
MAEKRLSTDVEFYFRSVAGGWKASIRDGARVLVFSPCLTSTTAEAVLDVLRGKSCEIYTRFRTEDFASGASSIRTLARLHAAGFSLFEIPSQHAKIILVPGVFVSMGSQNLTRQGTLNREATVVFNDPNAVDQALAMVQPWLEQRRPITGGVIAELSDGIRPIMRLVRKAQRAAATLDEEIRTNEDARIEERKRKATEAARKVELQQRISVLRQKLALLCQHGSVDWLTAAKFVEESTWWLHHPLEPVSAPKYRLNLIGGNDDRKLKLGANTFHVGRAICNCAGRFGRWLDEVQTGEEASIPQLRRSLRSIVCGSVSNAAGHAYKEYPTRGDEMIFWAISIDVSDFVRCFLHIAGVTTVFPRLGPKLR